MGILFKSDLKETILKSNEILIKHCIIDSYLFVSHPIPAELEWGGSTLLEGRD